MCDDALKGRERENQLFPLTLRILFSTVTYSLLISLMHILPYWLTNCIAKKRSACKNHNSAATHNERAFFRENSAFALSHSIILSSGKEYMCTWSYKALEWNFHVHSRSICKRLIRRDDDVSFIPMRDAVQHYIMIQYVTATSSSLKVKRNFIQRAT